MMHSIQMKETHNSVNHLLSAVYNQEHKWLICGDLNVVGLVLDRQVWYTKYLSFLSLWDSRADDQHYVPQECPLRQRLEPGSFNA